MATRLPVRNPIAFPGIVALSAHPGMSRWPLRTQHIIYMAKIGYMVEDALDAMIANHTDYDRARAEINDEGYMGGML